MVDYIHRKADHSRGSTREGPHDGVYTESRLEEHSPDIQKKDPLQVSITGGTPSKITNHNTSLSPESKYHV